MSPKKRGIRRFLSLFLALSLSFSLTGCEKLPPEAISVLEVIPAALTKTADFLDELALRLSDYLAELRSSSPSGVSSVPWFSIQSFDACWASFRV